MRPYESKFTCCCSAHLLPKPWPGPTQSGLVEAAKRTVEVSHAHEGFCADTIDKASRSSLQSC